MSNFVAVFYAASALLIGQVNAARARTLILCKGAGSDIVISLDEKRAFGRMLNCIVRSDFVADMTPCAPTNGFGFSASTGSADLVGVGDRWQDMSANAHGGVVSSTVSSDKIGFEGGFYFDDKDGFQREWGLHLDRLSGKAVLKLKGKPDSVRTCEIRRRKL